MGKVVNCNYRVNVRSGPGTRYSKIGTAPKDSRYVVTGKSGSWYKIIFNGRIGYIYKKYLSVYKITAIEPLILGYYGSWAAYSGYTPLSIPADKLDIVAYAFARVGDDLNVKMGDTRVDLKNFEDLKMLKENHPQLKTLISIGGWSGSGKFSDAALSAHSRAAFADSAAAFMKQHGFDGVDIDWEYPVSGGLSTNTRRPQDKANFTFLMAELRKKLDAQGKADGRKYLLTFAGGSGKFYTDNVELKKLAGYVDYALVMTYDIHGPWSGYTDFNSPLYAPAASSPQSKWSCDDAVRLWESCGFPRSKMIMGVPFYGYKYDGVSGANSGLFQRFSSSQEQSYDDIAASYLSKPPYNHFVHSQARVPWLYGGSVFISYDDEYSIGQKGAYIKDNALAGAGIWELSQNKDGKLLKALYEGMEPGG